MARRKCICTQPCAGAVLLSGSIVRADQMWSSFVQRRNVLRKCHGMRRKTAGAEGQARLAESGTRFQKLRVEYGGNKPNASCPFRHACVWETAIPKTKTSSRVEKACEDAEKMSASLCGRCGLCTGGAMQLNTCNIWAMVCEKGWSL